MKNEMKYTIFDTVSILRKLFAKIVHTNENNDRKIKELDNQVANYKEKREVRRSRAQYHIALPSSAPQKQTHG